MACEKRNIQTGFGTDTEFRDWGSAVSDLLTDNGLTKTADTGQINWTTVTKPGTNNTFAGYEIYTLTTDTEHAAFPLYIKLEFGVGNAATFRPALRVQTGSSTDGAGTLGGQLSTQVSLGSSANISGLQPYYVSAGDGYFVFAIAWTSADGTTSFANSIIHIERLRDNTGLATDDGIYVLTDRRDSSINENRCQAQIVNPTGSAFSLPLNRIGAMMLNQTGAVGADVYMATHHPVGRQLLNPLLGNLFYFSTDISVDSEVSIDMYGTATNYKALGQIKSTSTSQGLLNHFNFSPGYAMIWE